MNNTEKVKTQIFENPSKEFHIRLLARKTGLHPNTIITITDRLQKEGLLVKKKSSDTNLTLIRANTQNRQYKLQKTFYNINKINTSGLIDFLEKELSHPTIILFGSYAKGENHPESDIDLFIIAAEKKKIDANKYEDKLGVEIQLLIHTETEFGKLKKNNKELINNVINGYKITGYLEVL
ncbi:MAG: nucleotidyltransferase domain-containing protein [Candidatus Woesearchaeota archaeon]